MKKIRNFLLSMLLLLGFLLPDSVQASSADVIRLSGDNRVDTAIAVSQEVYAAGTAPNVVLAGWHGEVDALTGTLLASAKKAPLLLINKYDASIKAELNRLGTRNVYLLGGEQLISQQVVKELEQDGYQVKRVAGKDRWATAAAVAQESIQQAEQVFLANDGRSGSLADALATGPVSGKNQRPILLSSNNHVPEVTLDALSKLQTKEITIVGGTTVVSPHVQTTLEQAGYTVNRIAGDNRWDTAKQIAERYFTGSEQAIVANDGRSGSFADALVGGYLGAHRNAPILLTQSHQINNATREFIIKQTTNVYLMGGPSVVGDQVLTSITSILEGDGIGDIEPNDTFDTASLIKIEGTIIGDLPVADVDYFKVEVPTEGRFVARIKSLGGEGLNLDLYDNNHNNISWTSNTTSGTVSGNLKPGIYYIQVKTFRSQRSESYDLTTSFTPSIYTDEKAGNYFTNATVIDIGEEINGTIGYGVNNRNTHDYFKVEVPSEGRFVARIKSLSGEGLNLDLYDNNHNNISWTSNTTSGTVSGNLKPGTYYIRVETFRSQRSDSYDLTTSFTPSIHTDEKAGDYFTNAKAIDIGEEIHGTIGYGVNNRNAKDYFKVEIPSEGRFVARIKSLGGEGLNLDLYDNNHNNVSWTSNTTSGTVSGNLKPGTYYIRVETFRSQRSDSYDLTTSFIAD